MYGCGYGQVIDVPLMRPAIASSPPRKTARETIKDIDFRGIVIICLRLSLSTKLKIEIAR